MSTYQQVVGRGKAPSAKHTASVADAPEDGNVRALNTGRVPEQGSTGTLKKSRQKLRPEGKSRQGRKSDAMPLEHKAVALSSQAGRTPQEMALRSKLRDSEAEGHILRQTLDKFKARAVELERAQKVEANARQNVERDLKLLMADRARLAVHYDRLVDSKSWRAMAPFRLLRNVAGDVQAAVRTAPIHFQVRLDVQSVVALEGEGQAFTLIPMSRRMPRGWVRLRTESGHQIFRGPLRLYFDIGGGFHDLYSLDIPANENGDFDVICKLPRHITGLMMRATASEMPYGEIVAYPKTGIAGVATILWHELALTS